MRKLIFTLIIWSFSCAISQAYADYAEVPAECGEKDHCIKLLSITTDVTTNFGYTRSNVKCGLWMKLHDSRPVQLIFHQPKNAPLHDVINIAKGSPYIQGQDRVVLKDEDTEAMLKFNSHCNPNDFASGACTSFDIKMKTQSKPDHWSLIRLEIIDNTLYLHGSSSSEKVNKLYLVAHADSVALFQGETKAHFSKIEFSE